MPVTFGDKHPSYSTDKHWVGKFGTGHMSAEDENVQGDQVMCQMTLHVFVKKHLISSSFSF
jgi:hypothetical protein